MTEKAPKVSVIIPTYNRAHLVGRVIDAWWPRCITIFEFI